MPQSKLNSAFEACLNTLIGFVVAFISQIAICYLFDIPLAISDGLLLNAGITIISVIRSYMIRRAFNRRLLSGKGVNPLKAKQQSKLESFLEALLNTLIGFMIGFGSQIIICYILGIPLSFGDGLILAIGLTLISVIRGYIIRRAFEKRHFRGPLNWFEKVSLGVNK